MNIEAWDVGLSPSCAPSEERMAACWKEDREGREDSALQTKSQAEAPNNSDDSPAPGPPPWTSGGAELPSHKPP